MVARATVARRAPGRTRHFVDPSLAVAALGADPDRLLADLESLGLLFESLVIRDLRITRRRSARRSPTIARGRV